MLPKALENYGLDLRDLCGQDYDGSGNMAGKCRGAATCIQSAYPNAVYVHCASHTLNLCVVAACSVQEVDKYTCSDMSPIYLSVSESWKNTFKPWKTTAAPEVN